jgi:hypothetical protein
MHVFDNGDDNILKSHHEYTCFPFFTVIYFNKQCAAGN